jgi:hypothetical protein
MVPKGLLLSAETVFFVVAATRASGCRPAPAHAFKKKCGAPRTPHDVR